MIDSNNKIFEGKKIGFAVTASHCTFDKTAAIAETFVRMGAELLPVMSDNAYNTDTRFGRAKDFTDKLEGICGRKIIHTIHDAEPIGPKKMADLMLVCPCTGNTMAKLANSITDTAVTMAVKSHIRGGGPVVLAIASNDALAGTAKNLGILLNLKPYYFVPFKQDDYHNKPTSMVADFDKVYHTVSEAFEGRQLQPVITAYGI